MKITRDLIFAGQSIFGGWARAQVECLGIKWPLRKGWIAEACEREVNASAADRFLSLKNAHVDPFAMEHHRNMQHMREIR